MDTVWDRLVRLWRTDRYTFWLSVFGTIFFMVLIGSGLGITGDTAPAWAQAILSAGAIAVAVALGDRQHKESQLLTQQQHELALEREEIRYLRDATNSLIPFVLVSERCEAICASARGGLDRWLAGDESYSVGDILNGVDEVWDTVDRLDIQRVMVREGIASFSFVRLKVKRLRDLLNNNTAKTGKFFFQTDQFAVSARSELIGLQMSFNSAHTSLINAQRLHLERLAELEQRMGVLTHRKAG